MLVQRICIVSERFGGPSLCANKVQRRCRLFGYRMLSCTNSPHANKFPTARFEMVRVGAGPRDLLCDRTVVKQALKGL